MRRIACIFMLDRPQRLFKFWKCILQLAFPGVFCHLQPSPIFGLLWPTNIFFQFQLSQGLPIPIIGIKLGHIKDAFILSLSERHFMRLWGWEDDSNLGDDKLKRTKPPLPLTYFPATHAEIAGLEVLFLYSFQKTQQSCSITMYVLEGSNLQTANSLRLPGMFSHGPWACAALLPSGASEPTAIFAFNNNNLIASLTLLPANDFISFPLVIQTSLPTGLWNDMWRAATLLLECCLINAS